MNSKLANYLRTYRKRSDLSKDDIAFLLGCKSGTAIARYESCSRVPSLRTALALEVILGAHMRELFAGLCENAERDVTERARALEGFAERATNARRVATLRALANAQEDDVVWEPL